MANRRAPGSKPSPVLPAHHPTSLIALDESGSRATGGAFFVVGGLKIRRAGVLARRIQHVRDTTGWVGQELKFAEITQRSLPVYYEIIEAIAESDAMLIGTVVDQGRQGTVAFHGREPWEISRDVSVRLIHGSINQGELASVVMDQFSTPVGVAIDDEVKAGVNRRLRRMAIVTATCLDSRSTDVLQAADLVASAIAFDRRRRAGTHGSTKFSTASPKAKVTRRLQEAFGLTDFGDSRSPRVNVATLGCVDRASRPSGARALRAVRDEAS